ncbi:RNA methyltransferase [Halomonas vilamensis]|uniref:tRNA (cytidine/uridine-2'-O-)-methyltransferase TrmJ n=1 Tax=Vreelandella vilamensis TaxID=531309 RepID=A0ABU1H274_9GAMM|nr:RNA methyltransferase [Halomonas vilamensis]MDR5898398.1 RNA methyltransferase [Halomonas vilamensis]
MLSNIRIILVQTFHPGNIGATARAMKTMGLEHLTLVNPRVFPDDEATRLAAGATDVLENAHVVSSLDEAVQDCVQVVGASARLRSMPLPHFDEPDEMAQSVIENAAAAPVALVFGRERSGLTNDEIRVCTHQVSIPANPDYGILNLSQAVQILAYEVHRCFRKRPDSGFTYQTPTQATPPSREQFGYFQDHLHQVMHKSGFITQPHARTEEQLQALFARAEPSRRELSLLRGLLSAVEAHLPDEPTPKE